VKNSLFKKIFSSSIQAVAVQVLAVLFYYFISLYVSKENFGIISWVNAFSMFLTTLLSFGLDQVIIRRIAVSKTSGWAATAYLFHSFAGSLAMLLAVIVVCLFFSNSNKFSFLPIFFLAQSIVFIASPLKLFLNAKEKFTPYGIIALLSNLGKIVAFLLLVKRTSPSVNNIALLLIVFALFEFFSLLIYVVSNPLLHSSFTFKFRAYKMLLKEAAPQYVAVIFDNGLSRIDWILLGIISTNVIIADYSFAYRAFEIAKLPIIIIAPMLLPYFARIFSGNKTPDQLTTIFIRNIFLLEIFIAVCLVLCLNILWTPAVSYITNGKYGRSNAMQFFILSLCIPFQFFINLLWTMCFSQKKYRSVSYITIISACSNLILNLILIPVWGGVGAAIAFLITNVIQAGGYYFGVAKEFTSFPIKKIPFFFAVALTAYFVSGFVTAIIVLRLIVAVALYITVSLLFRQIKNDHWTSLKLLLRE
jgi:O-antigen/teichoic acid export membrane protein